MQANDCPRGLLPIALRVLGLVVVLLAGVLVLHRTAAAAGLGRRFLAVGRVVAAHLAFAHRRLQWSFAALGPSGRLDPRETSRCGRRFPEARRSFLRRE